MSEDRLRKALFDFDRTLEPLVSDEMQRAAFVEAVWGLLEVLLDRVTLIAYRVDDRAIERLRSEVAEIHREVAELRDLVRER